MSYLDTVNEKKNLHAQTSKEQQDQAAMFNELKKMQMAALMGQSKPSIVLTDQTDLGDRLGDFIDKLAETIKSTDTTGYNKAQVEVLNGLKAGLEQLETAVNDSKTDNSDLIAAIKKIDLKPVINLPAPVVNLEKQAIDFTPLQDTIREYFKTPEIEDEKIDLECYRAQDITDNGDIQYIGFVNPDGNWYIIENKVRENQMRYCFGAKGYAKAFKKAAQWEYSLLNEAIASAAA